MQKDSENQKIVIRPRNIYLSILQTMGVLILASMLFIMVYGGIKIAHETKTLSNKVNTFSSKLNTQVDKINSNLKDINTQLKNNKVVIP